MQKFAHTLKFAINVYFEKQMQWDTLLGLILSNIAVYFNFCNQSDDVGWF